MALSRMVTEKSRCVSMLLSEAYCLLLSGSWRRKVSYPLSPSSSAEASRPMYTVSGAWASLCAFISRRLRSGTSALSIIRSKTTLGMRLEMTHSQGIYSPEASCTPRTRLFFTSIFVTSVLYQMSPPRSRMRLSKASEISWLRPAATQGFCVR